uniref:EGF-like domain-containing protein n=1 Tax=Timema monikensis TaxID=170555 RepID=A0A7R9EG39_9NEOP|nr:unnamed protein product [Timema monikensis]
MRSPKQLANALVVLSQTAEDGEIEVRISVGATVRYCPLAVVCVSEQRFSVVRALSAQGYQQDYHLLAEDQGPRTTTLSRSSRPLFSWDLSTGETADWSKQFHPEVSRQPFDPIVHRQTEELSSLSGKDNLLIPIVHRQTEELSSLSGAKPVSGRKGKRHRSKNKNRHAHINSRNFGQISEKPSKIIRTGFEPHKERNESITNDKLRETTHQADKTNSKKNQRKLNRIIKDKRKEERRRKKKIRDEKLKRRREMNKIKEDARVSNTLNGVQETNYDPRQNKNSLETAVSSDNLVENGLFRPNTHRGLNKEKNKMRKPPITSTESSDSKVIRTRQTTPLNTNFIYSANISDSPIHRQNEATTASHVYEERDRLTTRVSSYLADLTTESHLFEQNPIGTSGSFIVSGPTSTSNTHRGDLEERVILEYEGIKSITEPNVPNLNYGHKNEKSQESTTERLKTLSQEITTETLSSPVDRATEMIDNALITSLKSHELRTTSRETLGKEINENSISGFDQVVQENKNSSMKMSRKGDLSCLIGSFVSAPRVENAQVKYVRVPQASGSTVRSFLGAEYECEPGYRLQPVTAYKVVCRRRSWEGIPPRCVPTIEGGQEATRNISNNFACERLRWRCDQICQEVEDKPVCSCYRGFRLQGSNCVDVDECVINNGGCEDLCINSPGSYHCQCPKGLRLSVNGKTCLDINECLLRNGHGPCQDTCTNLHGGYTCSCDGIPGTQLAADNHTCEDVDECSGGTAGCSHTCLNTLGRVFCLCPPGWELGADWKTCQDIDECQDEELQTERCGTGCVNTIGSYHCTSLGDEQSDDGITEQESVRKEVKSKSQSTAYVSQTTPLASTTPLLITTPLTTTPLITTPTTTTPPTTTPPTTRPTTTTPLASTTPLITTSPTTTPPTTTPPTPLSTTTEREHVPCSPGFTASPAGTCEDVDECSSYNGGCSHSCHNTLGGSYCLCPPHLMLATDWRTCHEMSTEPPTTLVPVTCPPGFDIPDTGERCADVNECAQNNGGCAQYCSNSRGSFRCSCRLGYALDVDGRSCIEAAVAAVCPPLDTPPHGYLLCHRQLIRAARRGRRRVVNHAGTVCELKCPHGSRLRGVYRKTCHKGGYWVGPDVGYCLREYNTRGKGQRRILSSPHWSLNNFIPLLRPLRYLRGWIPYYNLPKNYRNYIHVSYGKKCTCYQRLRLIVCLLACMSVYLLA